MKKLFLLPVISIVVSAAMLEGGRMYHPRTSKPGFFKEEAGGAIAYWFNLRKNPQTGELDYDAMRRGQQEVARHDAYMGKKSNGQITSGTLSWKELGPSNVGGRTRALLIDRNNPNKMYAGGVAGGLWISTDKGATWNKWSGSDQLSNSCIACIAQAPNGDIYFGTGEGLYGQYGFGAGGMMGGGMWRSSDGGNTFNLIPSTVPAGLTPSAAWAAINAIAFDPNNPNKIYAATNNGFRLSVNNGLTWMHPIRFVNGNPSTTSTTDIEVTPDGVVFAAVGAKCYKSLTGDSATFVNISTGGTSLPNNNTGRIELALSPSDPNFLYACTTSGGLLHGVWQSIDKGITWKLIGPGGSSFFSPFGSNGQGDYDNALGVDPFDKTHLVLGGVELWRWKQNTPTSYGQGQWSQIATEGSTTSPYYVHSDKHVILFDKNTQGTCYIAGDGGVSRSLNMNASQPTYAMMNFDYNVTQCYSIAFEHCNTSPLGDGVTLGTQDNGTQFVTGYPNGANKMWAVRINGGDGADTEISQINPDAIFASVYYGKISRSSNHGGTMSGFFPSKITKMTNYGSAGFASFVTPIALYESANATNSPDSVLYTADQNYAANSIVGVMSATDKQYFGYQTPVALTKGQQVKVQDIIQSKIVVGFSSTNGIWMTKKAIDFTVTPEWYRIAGSAKAGRTISGDVESFAWSADGDVLFVGTSNGYLYRISNLAAVVDSTTGDIGDNITLNTSCIVQQATIKTFGGGRYVTGISVDPSNANNVMVSLANYGYTDYVYYSTNALGVTPNFVSKQGSSATKLPAIPAYSILIEKSNPKRVIAATEWGVYKTEDISQPPSSIVWTKETGNGLANVPVFAIRQQRLDPWMMIDSGNVWKPVPNSGRIYIGTHGRGVFSCDNYFSPATGIAIKEKRQADKLTVFPNPSDGNSAVYFTLNKSAAVSLSIYDLNGKLCKTINAGEFPEGEHSIALDAAELPAGTYFLSVDWVAGKSAARVVIAH